jgi:4-diphosphocytidyl-2-C-methyl-D-erythritol kinase
MIVFPNAKINIGLNVTSKREDGFHNIESIFYPIPWCDALEINKSDKFEFTTSGLSIDGSSNDNLIVKAYLLIKERFNISACKIHLHKQIPMGAGLGGGSADAAFTLSALNTLFNLKLSTKELESLANLLGSDCPFFIENTPKYVTGKGEIMESINLDLSGYYIKLVNPNIHISTKTAFSNTNPKASDFDLKESILKPIYQISKCIQNDFEESIFSENPILESIKIQLKNEGALFTSMTGTGSTIYGIYKNEPELTFIKFTEKIIKF